MKPNPPPRPLSQRLAGLEISITASLVLQAIANLAGTVYFAPAGAPVTLIAAVGCAFAAIPFVTAGNACRLGRCHQILDARRKRS